MDRINQINEQIIKRQEEGIEHLKSLLKTKDLIISELKEQLRIGGVVGQSEQLPKNNRCVANPDENCDCDTVCIDIRT